MTALIVRDRLSNFLFILRRLGGAAFVASLALVFGACALQPDETASTEQAVTGDKTLGDQIRQYGYGSLAQFSTRKFAYVGGKVSDFATLESDLNAMLPMGVATCTRANGCLHVVNENGGTTGLPTSDTAADRHDAALALAAQHAMEPSAPLYFIDPPSKTGTALLHAVQASTGTLGLSGFEFGWGLASTDTAQTSIDTWITNHPIVSTAPIGLITSTKVVQVGGSDYSGSNADTTWSGFTGTADIDSVVPQIPQVQEGSAVTADNFVVGPALILMRLGAQSSAPANRATLLAAAGSHFNGVSTATVGVFKDASDL